MFNLEDILEYTPEFKKELEQADYIPSAINRKFSYQGEGVWFTGEKVCHLYCLDGKIKVRVSPEHLVKVS